MGLLEICVGLTKQTSGNGQAVFEGVLGENILMMYFTTISTRYMWKTMSFCQ